MTWPPLPLACTWRGPTRGSNFPFSFVDHLTMCFPRLQQMSSHSWSTSGLYTPASSVLMHWLLTTAVSIRRTASAPEICSEEEKKHKTRANKHKVESSKSLMVYRVRIFCPVEWCSSRREQQSKTWFTCLDRKSKYVSFININSDLSVTGWYNCTNMEVRCQERLFTLTCTSEWVGAFLFPSVYHSILLTHLSLHVGPAPWNHLLLSLWPPPLLPPLLCLPLVFLPFIQLFPLSSGPDNGTLASASRRAHQADWVFSQRSPRASG